MPKFLRLSQSGGFSIGVNIDEITTLHELRDGQTNLRLIGGQSLNVAQSFDQVWAFLKTAMDDERIHGE